LPLKGLAKDTFDFLMNYRWPGNIRELENVIQKAIILAQGGWITKDILMTFPLQHDRLSSNQVLLNPSFLERGALEEDKILRSLDDIQKEAMIHTLEAKNGNIKQAAEVLGISRTTFYNKAKKYNLPL
jgi:transcriptional regulator of acetoin/glycerol metabolism